MSELSDFIDQLRSGDTLDFVQYTLLRGMVDVLEAKLSRIESLIEMEHNDSLVRVSVLRALLKDPP